MGWLLFLLALLAAAPAHSDQIGAGPAPGTAATRSELGGCVYQNPALAPTAGQQMGFSCDSTGKLETTGTATIGGTVTVTPVSASTWPVHLDGIASNITALPVSGTDAFGANTGKAVTIQGGSSTPVLITSTGTTNVQGVANGVAVDIIGTDALGANTGKVVTVQGANGGGALPISGAVSGSGTFTVSAVSTTPIQGNVIVGNTTPLVVEGLTAGVALNVLGTDAAHVNAAKFVTVQGGVYIDPVGTVGIQPTLSAAGAAALLLKASGGQFWGGYAVNSTGTAGFLLVINQTSVPADGTVTAGSVIDCVPLPANGTASIAYRPGPPRVYNTGIVMVVTSASTCFTKTTGVITAFITGDYQ